MKSLAFLLLAVSIIACSRDLRDEIVTLENIDAIAAALVTSDLTVQEKRNLLGYYEVHAIYTAMDNPDSVAWLPDLPVGKLLGMSSNAYEQQQVHISVMDKLGASILSAGETPGEMMDIAAFASVEIPPGRRSWNIMQGQRAARFLLSRFSGLYAETAPQEASISPDTLTRTVLTSAGVIIELPR
jgi:hypothetical protein